ncbi:hypothetical protein J2S13_001926 [Oikeobacillus pervagus]|uniref:Uncharacterized protein n=1 Tax=Oikeobacillus pervagus TaxID=1325931 RepID=A0AAJ1WJI8_9BACI|nr:hypothetical protein [Oikeobacillus pervagus]MDQ0215508.1 hypothetical protein [Oikeobacillus pervagus]
MKKGSTVLYNGEEYTIFWMYDNETFEIKKKNSLSKFRLVTKSDIQILE